MKRILSTYEIDKINIKRFKSEKILSLVLTLELKREKKQNTTKKLNYSDLCFNSDMLEEIENNYNYLS